MTTLYEFGKIDNYNGTEISDFMIIGSACGEIDDVRVDGNSVVVNGIANINLTNYATKQYVDDNLNEKVSWSGDTNGAKKTIGTIDNYGIGFITNNIERLNLDNDGFISFNNTKKVNEITNDVPNILSTSAQLTTADAIYSGYSILNNTIHEQFRQTSFQGSINIYYRYINSAYTLSFNAPTTQELIPYNLSGTSTTTHTFNGILDRNGFYSPKSTYAKSIYFSGLTQNTTYTISVMNYSIKGQSIFNISGSFTTSQNQTTALFVMQIPNSIVYQNKIEYVSGDTLQEIISISKSTPGSNNTIYVSSNPTSGQISTMIRYGGSIYANDVYIEHANQDLEIWSSGITSSITSLTNTIGNINTILDNINGEII